MLNPLFSFEAFDSNGINDLWSNYGFCHESPLHKGASFPSPSDPRCCSEFMAVEDDMQFDAVSAALQFLGTPKGPEDDLEKAVVLPEECISATSAPLLELLNKYILNSRCFNGEMAAEPSFDKQASPAADKGELSTEEVMRVAAAHFIQLSSNRGGDPSMLQLPFGLMLSGLSGQEIKNVELASLLFSVAEKVSNQQYDRASNLLRHCYQQSSSTGNPVQRVVYYFAEALQERIDRETGRLSLKRRKERGLMTAEVLKAMLVNHPLLLIAYKKLPFGQLSQFTSIQAILDHIATAKRIHMIDLSIKFGLQWAILMQALSARSACPVDSLKITAISTSEEQIDETGRRLSSFAKSLSLPFKFKAVIVPDMKDLREDMFELEAGEAVGVYSQNDMNTMIPRPRALENLMRVIRKLRPCIMTVMDVEAKHNSPSFINRFTEALFYFSAFFDCLHSLMDEEDTSRMIIEERFFSEGIRSIVATEGSERVVRQVGVSVWRAFFARFGLVEAELNEWSLYQASLLVKQFVNGSSCNDGAVLIIPSLLSLHLSKYILPFTSSKILIICL